MTPTKHRLPPEHLNALLRGSGDAETIALLRGGQLSKHTLLLRAVLDIAAATSSRALAAAGTEVAYTLLCEVQGDAPEAVANLLLHPHVGAWAVHCLQHLHQQSADDAGLSRELAHLSAVAASAAVIAGHPFEIDVPVLNGLVLLPALGAAHLPGAMSARVRRDASGVRVLGDSGGIPVPAGDPHRDRPGWRAVRRLTAEAGGLAIAVDLDDLDPYRGRTYPSVADRLGDEAVGQWQRLFAEAWALLVAHHEPYARALAAGLRSVVPQVSAEPGRSISATSTDAFGAVAMSLPPDAATFALTLIHEFQHAKLSALLDLVPLYRAQPGTRYYAPWRDDPRPMGGLLQGIYAFVGVTDFWRVHRHHEEPARAPLAHFEFARWREQTRRAIDELSVSPEFTGVGRELIAGLRSTMDGWSAEPVPEELADQARDSALDHRARWRIRNIAPDAGLTDELVDAWRAGKPSPEAPGGVEMIDGAAASVVDTARFRLWHMRMTDPGRFQRLRSGDLHDPTLAEVAAADIEYAAGDYLETARLYRERIEVEPDFAGAWLGLALARLRSGERETAAALLARPELLLAVHRRLREENEFVDPEVLARWLDRLAVGVRKDRS